MADLENPPPHDSGENTAKPLLSEYWAPAYFELANAIFVVLNRTGEVSFINRKGCELLGCGEHEVVGKNWFDNYLMPEEREEVQGVFQSLIESGKEPVDYYENFVRTSSGQKKLIAWRNTFIADEDGRITSVVSAGEDITERRRSENELREKETRLSTILNNMVDGLITIDERGVIESANRAACEMFGYTADELVGSQVGNLMLEPYRSEHDDYIQRYIQSGEARIIGKGREVDGCRKNGEVFPISLAVSEMEVGSKKVFVGNIRDLTEERHLQEQIQQGEKVAAMSELVAGIAHEIGGALSVISGNAQFLEKELAGDDSRSKDVEGIIRESDAVADLIGRLLDFSRPAKLELRSVDLSECLRSVYYLVRKQSSKENIEIKLDLQVGLPEVMGDPNQLDQVFMNLVINAMHAMPDGGTLTLRSMGRSREGTQEMDKVCVEIVDTGKGIHPDDLTRIFEPYFTKGKEGRGTGLGLAISRRIVNDHQGDMSVSSVLGKGSTFTVELPVGSREGEHGDER